MRLTCGVVSISAMTLSSTSNVAQYHRNDFRPPHGSSAWTAVRARSMISACLSSTTKRSSESLSPKWRYSVPTPTPAYEAISAGVAETPRRLKTVLAASKTAARMTLASLGRLRPGLRMGTTAGLFFAIPSTSLSSRRPLQTQGVLRLSCDPAAVRHSSHPESTVDNIT